MLRIGNVLSCKPWKNAVKCLFSLSRWSNSTSYASAICIYYHMSSTLSTSCFYLLRSAHLVWRRSWIGISLGTKQHFHFIYSLMKSATNIVVRTTTRQIPIPATTPRITSNCIFLPVFAGTVDGDRTRTTLIESQRELPIILLRHINASHTQTLANALPMRTASKHKQ